MMKGEVCCCRGVDALWNESACVAVVSSPINQPTTAIIGHHHHQPPAADNPFMLFLPSDCLPRAVRVRMRELRWHWSAGGGGLGVFVFNFQCFSIEIAGAIEKFAGTSCTQLHTFASSF